MIGLTERLIKYNREGFFVGGQWHLLNGDPQEAFLGKGASARVYAVRSDETGEIAALKIIYIDESLKNLKPENWKKRLDEERDRVEKEIKIMDKLRGMNRIAYFLDSRIVERDDSLPGSCDVLIRMQKLIPWEQRKEALHLEKGTTAYQVEALRIWRDMSEALQICENKAVIHADVKPDNVLYSEDNESYMLSDFGVSINGRTFSPTDRRRGTPPYMAPEMHYRRGGDSRADMYSLAAMIYQMLNGGVIPVQWDTKHEFRVVQHPVPRIKGVPGEVNDVLIKCLEEDPEKRYQSWSAVKDLTNTLYVKYRTGFPQEKQEKKWKKPVIVAGLLAVVAGAGIFLASVFGGRRAQMQMSPEAQAVAEVIETPLAEAAAIPAMEPTAEPTAVPTAEPTAAPTAEPTAVPTAEPTAAPTAEPTAVPTAEPTAAPTAEPTAAPTAEPTAEPTAVPTAEPTAVPTAEPTAVPTAEPTVKPSLGLALEEGSVPADTEEVSLHGHVAVTGNIDAQDLALSVNGNLVEALWEPAGDGYDFIGLMDMDLEGVESVSVRVYTKSDDGVEPIDLALPVASPVPTAAPTPEPTPETYGPIILDGQEDAAGRWVGAEQVISISGTAQPDKALDVAVNGSLIGSYIVEADGTFVVDMFSSALTEGENAVTIRYAQASGEGADYAAEMTLRLDATAPVITTAEQVDQGTQSIAVQIEDQDGACHVSLSADGRILAEATAENGTAELKGFSGMDLAAAETITVTAVDGAGNSASVPVAFQWVLGAIAVDGQNALEEAVFGPEDTAMVTGLAEPGSTLRISCGDTVETASADEQGAFSWSPAAGVLRQGENTVTIGYDEVGGLAIADGDAAVCTLHLHFDGEAPQVEVSPVQLAYEERTLLVTVSGEDYCKVSLVVDGSVAAETDMTPAAEPFTMEIPAELPLDKTSQIAVMVEDPAGNVSSLPVRYVTVEPIAVTNAAELTGRVWGGNDAVTLQVSGEAEALLTVSVNGQARTAEVGEAGLDISDMLVSGSNSIRVSYAEENGFPAKAVEELYADVTVECDFDPPVAEAAPTALTRDTDELTLRVSNEPRGYGAALLLDGEPALSWDNITDPEIVISGLTGVDMKKAASIELEVTDYLNPPVRLPLTFENTSEYMEAYAFSESEQLGSVPAGGTAEISAMAFCSDADMRNGYVTARLAAGDGAMFRCTFSRQVQDQAIYEAALRETGEKISTAYADSLWQITGVEVPAECPGGDYELQLVFDTENSAEPYIYPIGVLSVEGAQKGSKVGEAYTDEEHAFAIGFDEPLQSAFRSDGILLTGWVRCAAGAQAYFDRWEATDAYGRTYSVYIVPEDLTRIPRNVVDEKEGPLADGTGMEGFVLKLDLSSLGLVDGDMCSLRLYASDRTNESWPTVEASVLIDSSAPTVTEQELGAATEKWVWTEPVPTQAPESAAG